MGSPQIEVELRGAGASRDLPAAALVRTFHRWIREERLQLLMIDVADYSHVPGSPSVLLVCHEGVLGVEGGSEGVSLRYSRRRPGRDEDAAADPLATALGVVLAVAAELEKEPELEGALRFPVDPLTLRVNDRRVGEESRAAWEAELRRRLGALAPELEDARFTPLHEDRLAVSVALPGAPEPRVLRERLRGAGVVG